MSLREFDARNPLQTVNYVHLLFALSFSSVYQKENVDDGDWKFSLSVFSRTFGFIFKVSPKVGHFLWLGPDKSI